MVLKRIIKFFKYFIYCLAIFFVVALFAVNLPFSQRFISKKVNGILIKNELPVRLDRITLLLNGKIGLRRILMYDLKQDTIAYVEKLNISAKLLPLIFRKIIVKNLTIHNANVNISADSITGKPDIISVFIRGSEKTESGQKTGKKWEISCESADLENIRFSYNDLKNELRISQYVGRLSIGFDEFSIIRKQIFAGFIDLDQARGSITIRKNVDSTVIDKKSMIPQPWNFKLNRSDLRNIRYTVNQPDANQSMEFSLLHGKVSDAGFELESMTITAGKTEIRNGSVRTDVLNEQDTVVDRINLPYISDISTLIDDIRLSRGTSGLNVRELSFTLGESLRLQKGVISILSDSISGTTFLADLKTTSSRVKIKIDAGGKINDIISSFREAPFALKLIDTEIAFSELPAFIPEIQEQTSWKSLEEIVLGMNCDISGTVNKLKIKDLNINNSSGFNFSASGSITGIMNPSSSFCSVGFTTGEILPRQVSSLISLFGATNQITGFEPFTISGTIDSSLLNPYFNLELKGGSGNITLNGSAAVTEKRYSLKMKFDGIEAGRLSGESDIGRVSGELDLRGKEYSPEKMKLNLTLSIDTANYRSFNYTGIKLIADGNQGVYSFGINSTDNLFKCDLNGSVDFNNSSIRGNFAGFLEADLGKLNLYKGTSFSTRLNGDLYKSAAMFKGSLSLENFVVSRDNKSEDLEKLSFSILSSDTLSTGKIESDFLNADAYFKGSPGALLKMLKENRIRGFAAVDSAVGNRIPYISAVSELKVTVNSLYDPFIGLFVDDTIFSYNKFSAGLLKETSGTAKAELSVDRINAGRNKVSGASISLESFPGKSVMGIKADSIQIGNLYLETLGTDLTIAGDTAMFRVKANNRADSLLYDISGVAFKSDGVIKMRSGQKDWVINGYRWNISSGDFLILEPRKNDFTADLHLRDDNHTLDIYGRKSERLFIETNEVDMRRLLVPGMENLKYDGILTGKISYRSKGGTKEAGIKMDIRQIMMDENLLGKMELSGNFLSDSLGNISSDLNAIINDTSGLKLNLRSDKKRTENSINADFSDIQLHNLEPLVRKYISGLQGLASGKLDVMVKDNKPVLNGNLEIKGASLKLIPVNGWYFLSDDFIKIENNTLTFSRFTVRDSMRNPLTLSGTLNLNDPGNITADLYLTSDRIQVMNTTIRDNAAFNGTIFVNSGINIRGPLHKPSINGNIVLAGGTVVNYRYMENLSVSETQKTITFESLKQIQTDTILIKPVSNPLSRSPDIEATVEINPNSVFNFQISKGFDISVSITGGGFLTYSLTPNKEMDLSGVYELDQGSSQLKIPGWPRKDFIIAGGSTIKWDGRIDDPELNLQTTSKIRGSYINPVDNKTREVNFLVIMKLSGRLSELEILFDVRSEDQYITTFFNSLSSDERMRQAINLLIFERVELPGQTSSSNYLTQQISQFAESQLNQATKSASKKLDLDVSVGLDTYTRSTTTGEQTTTSISYEVKKEMFNERGSVLLSGHTNTGNSTSQQTDAVIENFIFEYALDTSRTKFLKVYRQQNYEDLLEGEVIKSGVGFIYRKNYDRISDIWRKQKNSKK